MIKSVALKESSDDELKECPFCRGHAELKEDENCYWYVECQGCYVATHFFRKADDAEKSWQRRIEE